MCDIFKIMEISGIILAGDKSRRIKADKATLDLGNKTLIVNAIDILKPLCSQIIISRNRSAISNISKTYKTIIDENPDIGPVQAICSCLKKSDHLINVVLACDVPFVKPSFFSYLIRQYNFQKKGIVPVINGKYQPLIAVYHKSAFYDFEKRIKNKIFTLIDVIKTSNYQIIKINQLKENEFLNINTRADLEKARQYINQN